MGSCMENTSKHIIKEICNGVLCAGLIILAVGVYYMVFKAGIPYQDPTVEMQIQYAVNYGIGDVLLKLGLVFALCGGIMRFVIWRLFRNGKEIDN